MLKLNKSFRDYEVLNNCSFASNRGLCFDIKNKFVEGFNQYFYPDRPGSADFYLTHKHTQPDGHVFKTSFS